MKLRLWLVGLLLSKQSSVVTLNPTARHLIIVNANVFGQQEMLAIGKVCGPCTIVPVRMDLTPEGTKLRDVFRVFAIGK